MANITTSTQKISSPQPTSWKLSSLMAFMAAGPLAPAVVGSQRPSRVFPCREGSMPSASAAILWCLSGWTKKPVTVLSTLAQADITHTAQRRVRDGSRISVQCPDMVVLYNRYMAGMDKGDQYRQYYHVRTKSRKVYKYLFCFSLDVSITNSFILSSFAPTTMPFSHQHLKSFHLRLAEQLVGNYNSRKQLGHPSSRPVTHPAPVLPPQQVPMTQSTRTALHLPSKLKKPMQCVYYSCHRDPSTCHRVVWYCKDCLGKPPLCLTVNDDGSDCFRLWHHAFVTLFLLVILVTPPHPSFPCSVPSPVTPPPPCTPHSQGRSQDSVNGGAQLSAVTLPYIRYIE